jgi:glycosyltransferase involved in cell wall biosynthesis
VSRILWHSCSPWSPSGYGTQTATWIIKLTEMGHEVVVSSYWGLSGSPTTWNGITILPGFGGSYCSSSMFEHCKAVQPDIVITLGDIWVLDHTLLKQMPVAHWLPSDCRPMSLADRGCAEASGAKLLAMSRFGYDNFTRAGFDPSYCPHGIDTEMFSPPQDRDKLRHSMGIGEDDFVIGINGANNDAIRKALPEQMLAFARFHADHPEAILALHSGVHQEGGQDLEALAENLGITDRVRAVDQYRYHGGLMSPSDLAEWYGAIDVLSACAFGEGFGLPIIEAQGCGTPVITTDASSMPELNPHGISVGGEPFWNGVHKGWWIKPYVSEIFTAYEKVYEMRHDVNRDKLREWARAYDKDVVAEQYMKTAVEELLDKVHKV